MSTRPTSLALEHRSDTRSRMPGAWIRPLLRLLSPAGPRARLSVLLFHRVQPVEDPLFPGEMHAAVFRERMQWVRSWFDVLPLAGAVERLFAGTLPERALSITFDDGYADNATVALPILRELGLPATFFVASRYLDGGRMWNDTVIEAIRHASRDVADLSSHALGTHGLSNAAERRQAIDAIVSAIKYRCAPERERIAAAVAETLAVTPPTDLMMTSSQVRELVDAGMDIGAHTATHPILAETDADQALAEIDEGRLALEAITARPVQLFAYPNGKPGRDYTRAHVEMARRLRFSAAFSTSAGACALGSDRFQLPRFTPWDREPARYGLRLAANLFHAADVCA